MMEHPDELELLAYVEEEVPAAQRGVVARHVGTCSDCWARIRELETARSALRDSPQLELPAERRQRLLAILEAGTPERRSYVSPLRLATILAPVAVILAIVGAIVSFDLGNDLGGGGGDGSGGGVAAESRDQAEGGGGAEEVTTIPTFRVLVRRVQGPPDRVVDLLRRRGFNAAVEGNTVIVGEAPGVREALKDQPGGRVRVLVESTQPPE